MPGTDAQDPRRRCRPAAGHEPAERSGDAARGPRHLRGRRGRQRFRPPGERPEHRVPFTFSVGRVDERNVGWRGKSGGRLSGNWLPTAVAARLLQVAGPEDVVARFRRGRVRGAVPRGRPGGPLGPGFSNRGRDASTDHRNHWTSGSASAQPSDDRGTLPTSSSRAPTGACTEARATGDPARPSSGHRRPAEPLRRPPRTVRSPRGRRGRWRPRRRRRRSHGARARRPGPGSSPAGSSRPWRRRGPGRCCSGRAGAR